MVMEAICIDSLNQENPEDHSTNSCVLHAVAVNSIFQQRKARLFDETTIDINTCSLLKVLNTLSNSKRKKK